MSKKKRRNNMEAILNKCETYSLEDRLKYIASKATTGKTKDGKVILDKNDSRDIEWYGADERGDKK